MPDGEPASANIMIVEDEFVVASDLRDTLVEIGYRVVAMVATGEDAIARARSLCPTVILMDIRLAGELDGIAAAARIRSERDIPIVFLTAHTNDDTLRRAMATEPYGYIVKPFKAGELRCAIEVAIHKHEIMARLAARERWLAGKLRSLGDEVMGAGDPEGDAASDDARALDQELERRVALRTAQLQAANEELEAFSYSVAHDLRGPLRGIDGFSQILIEDHAAQLGPEIVDHLTTVRRAADRMRALIEDLLRLSRTAQDDLRRGPVDVSRLAREAIARLRAAEPHRAVTVDIADAITVSGDERFLAIVLDNLLGNAWKFTARRDRATICVGTVQQGDAEVCFVRDDGAGFDIASAGKLFAPFQRFHAASEFDGTGIGLAITQRIIQRHGGRIWADSAVGLGTTFYFAV
jgi:signal transduction histidine kinase